MIDELERWIAPLRRRISMIVARAKMSAVTEGAKGLQKVQFEFMGNTLDNVEYIEPYGFTSKPKAGAQVAVFFLNGNRDHGIVLSVADGRTRPRGLAEGDTALWTSSGAIVKLVDSTKNLEATVSKLKIENDSDELVAVLVEGMTELITTVQAIVDARTATLLGPQPLLNPADPFPARKAALSAVKTKLEGFKV